MMVPEGGTGSGTSAPSVNEIYKAIFGIEGIELDPKQAIIPDGEPDHRPADDQRRRDDRAAEGRRAARARPRAVCRLRPPTRRSPEAEPSASTGRGRHDPRLPADHRATRRRRSLASRATGRDSILRRLDWVLFLAALGTEHRRGGLRLLGHARRRRRARTRRPTSSATCSTWSSASVSAPPRCSSTTARCAPTRRSSTSRRSSAWSRCSHRWAARSTGRRPGSCCPAGSRSSRRSS